MKGVSLDFINITDNNMNDVGSAMTVLGIP
jgi:hypothetical protein